MNASWQKQLDEHRGKRKEEIIGAVNDDDDPRLLATELKDFQYVAAYRIIENHSESIQIKQRLIARRILLWILRAIYFGSFG